MRQALVAFVIVVIATGCSASATSTPLVADATATAVPRGVDATQARPTATAPQPTSAAASATADLSDLIRVTMPAAGDEVASPLTVTGEARGTWYFEADFPVTVEDLAGNELGGGVARADGDWMTADFVPFTADVTFVKPEGIAEGRLVLQRANPSGMPEHDKRLAIPVRFR